MFELYIDQPETRKKEQGKVLLYEWSIGRHKLIKDNGCR